MLESDGYDWRRAAVPAAVVESLREEAQRLALGEPDAAHGVRHLLRKSQPVRQLLGEPWLSFLVPADYACVRGILFDKTPGSNWLVAWHQDLTICVKERAEVPCYGPWSIKDGVPHVQPPVELLERMLTLRLHLDDTTSANGALRVIPGSHDHGRLDAAQIEQAREAGPEAICEAEAGDVQRMRPLILHASSKAESPAHRRIVHLEFAPRESLDRRLAWYEE